ncbi:hypothetical protein BBJ28_00011104 [Nothophytophthora sp. Chile5]|nr:hypothetical protein BBJ28_00011104 [Nothophytophthora sp. Chile5]
MENGIADELLVLEAAKEGHVTDMAQAQQKGAVEESRDSGSTPLVSADAKGYDEISLLLHEQETQILTTAATMVPSPLPAVTSPALRKDGTAAGIAAGSDQLAREPQVEPDASEAPAVCYQSVLSQLETFLELCSKMAETQVICEDVLARLLALHYWIDEQKLRVPDESEAAFYSIVTRFNATLRFPSGSFLTTPSSEKHGHSMLVRMVRSFTACGKAQEWSSMRGRDLAREEAGLSARVSDKRGVAPTLESDVYSFGMCVVEAVTKNTPWGLYLPDVVVIDKLNHQIFMERPAVFESVAHWTFVLSLCAFQPSRRLELSDAIDELRRFRDAGVARRKPNPSATTPLDCTTSVAALMDTIAAAGVPVKAPPKTAPPPNPNAADAKVRTLETHEGIHSLTMERLSVLMHLYGKRHQDGGSSVDPSKKKKALPPPSNPPPKGGTSAAAAFRAKSSLPPPNGPPPTGAAPSASVAKIRGAARPPSSGPPPNGGQAKAMAPPGTAPPPKSEAKGSTTPRSVVDSDVKSESKPVPAVPIKAKPDAKRTPPTSARAPPTLEAKSTPRAAPVDLLGNDSPVIANSTVRSGKERDTVPPAKPPKPVVHAQRAPMTAPPTEKAPAPKPTLVMKSTMEVLNDTSAALSARNRNVEEDSEASQRSSAITRSGTESGGVFTTKMGKAAQFSGQSRPNVPEEEVIIVKKREAKSAEVEPHDRGTNSAKPSGNEDPKISRSTAPPVPNLEDSFEDLEEIPFLEDVKPDSKTPVDLDTKPVEHEDDPVVVIESKHGPSKSSGNRSSSTQMEPKSEQKSNNLDEDKEEGLLVPRRNATHEDVYDELRKMRRGSRSPRDDNFTLNEPDVDSRTTSFSDKKDKVSSHSDDGAKETSSTSTSTLGREKSREKRKDRRRTKQEEPKKIQAQFFNPKSVPYIPDHLLDFVKRPLECGRGQIVKCFIERNDSGPNKLAPIYTLLLEVNSSSGRPIMYARKKAASRITSHYVISMNRSATVYDLFLSRMMRSHQYIGKLRSSTSMMEYCLYDQGDNPEDLDSDCEVDEELRQSIRAELAVVRYHYSKKAYPRKMEVVIPSILENGAGYMEWRPLSRDQMMEEHVRTITTAVSGSDCADSWPLIIRFDTFRLTKYDPLSSCIVDFRSRATCVSVKNFQLVHSEPTNDQMREQYRKAYPEYVYEDQGTVSLPQEHVLLQLGKVGKDCFNMDFQYPLSMLQAFAISLSRFDTKQRDKVPERNGEKFVVQELAFRPDGAQVVAAVGSRVLVYDAADGTLLHSLKGHRGTVYAVDYAHDGKRFASGGADNVVIIWTDKAEGILKYTHNESIQRLAYNPQSQCLASCTASDFGLWAPEQKSVAKHKVVAKILAACWSKDGQLLALGLLNGTVTLRDKQGAEKRLIERSNAPVWALAWSPATEEDASDVLAVGCWDRTLAFYTQSGAMQGKARQLAFNPTSLTYFSKGKYLLVGGSNRKAGLYTKDGIFLVSICEQESWVWALKARPKTNFVAVGCEDGSLSMYCLVFGTVHGIYQERYAYRENLTDVIVQHLMTEQKVRIKTRDCVKKLSVYRDRLAVQLSDRIIIYELAGGSGGSGSSSSADMHYRVKERIAQDLPCSLLVVTSLHFILCQKQKLQQYDFSGRKEREWVLEALIRYIKVTGGAPGREGLLVGLKDGSVWQIFINNPFPIPLIQQSSPISCLDISAKYVRKLAVVDDSHKCLVYDLATKQLLFEEGATNSVAWNTECEDMLCFGGNGQLKIRAGQFSGHTQRMQGFVVGFSGSKVFSLSALSVQTIDVPQSAPLYRYLEQNAFAQAYAVSCLGVTPADWRLLAWEALRNMRFAVARKAFIRVRDVRYIELVNALEQTWRQQLPQVAGSDGKDGDEGEEAGGEAAKKLRTLLQAEIMAHQGKFQLAAKLFADCEEPARAIKMFTDLRMWDEAKRFATARQAGDVKQLVLAQARWAEDVQDWRAAAEMYAASGNVVRAGEILGEHGWLEDLLALTRKPEGEASSQLLAAAAEFFLKGNQFANARDMYVKLGDVDALLQMHIRLQEWDEAVRLADKHRDRVRRPDDVFVPYAQWLVTQDRFDDALDAYMRAQRPDQGSKLLHQLIDNAVSERRFRAAAHYYWRLSDQQMGAVLGDTKSDPKQKSGESVELTEAQRALLATAMESELLSELYYAYAMIYAFTDEPFTTLLPEALFHAARFLLNKLAARGSSGKGKSSGGSSSGTAVVAPPPPGISLGNIYFTLGHHALQLESYKLARQAYDKLLQMKLRPDWQPIVECTAMTLQSRPYADREELLPVDYRSSTVNPLLNPNSTGDVCVNSGHPFVRSFVSFENLPLVEFQPEPGISDEEAEQLILTHPDEAVSASKRGGDGWRETDYGNGSQSMKMNDDDDQEPVEETPKDGADLFEQALNKQATYGAGVGHRSGAAQYRVLQVDARTLQALRPNEVFIAKYPTRALRPKYYKNMIPELKIHLSPHCRRFFHEEDFEFEYLKAGHCPCCQVAELSALNPPEDNDENDASKSGVLNGAKLK